MPDKNLTDNENVKACKDCLHYEACKGTYYSAKGDEDILYDFDGEMYAQSGCEEFKDKDLINRLQAENDRLNFVRTRDAQRYEQKISDQAHTNCVLYDMHSNAIKEVKELEDKLKTAKAEAYKDCIARVEERLSHRLDPELFPYIKDVLRDELNKMVGGNNA